MKSRIKYIDQLKGLLILLVIIGHFSSFGISPTKNDFHDFIYMFHMPFFFFLSGKVIKDVALSKLKLKIRGLLFPFLIVGSIFSLYFLGNPILWIADSNKLYFWYLLVLIYCVIVVSVANYLSEKTDWGVKSELLFVFSLYAISLVCSITFPQIIVNSLSLKAFSVRFPYFYIGYLSNRVLFIKKIENSDFAYIIALISFIPFYLLSLIPQYHMLYHCGAASVILILYRYFKHGLLFNKLSSLLSYFGEHSLDIYLYHGFVLTLINLLWLNELTVVRQNIVLEFVAYFVVSSLIACLSLIIGRIIRISPGLSKIIYGF